MYKRINQKIVMKVFGLVYDGKSRKNIFRYIEEHMGNLKISSEAGEEMLPMSPRQMQKRCQWRW